MGFRPRCRCRSGAAGAVAGTLVLLASPAALPDVARMSMTGEPPSAGTGCCFAACLMAERTAAPRRLAALHPGEEMVGCWWQGDRGRRRLVAGQPTDTLKGWAMSVQFCSTPPSYVPGAHLIAPSPPVEASSTACRPCGPATRRRRRCSRAVPAGADGCSAPPLRSGAGAKAGIATLWVIWDE